MSAIESLRFPSGRSVANCRKDAKRQSRLDCIPLHEALDAIAIVNGLDLPWHKAIAALQQQDPLPSAAPLRVREMTVADVQSIMGRHPELTHFGIGVYRPNLKTASELAASFKKERTSLLGAVAECNRAVRFLQYTTKRKTINFNRTSYGLKHRVEHYMRSLPDCDSYYVANGAFICAAIHMGFAFAPVREGSPNVCFNISERSPILEWGKIKDRRNQSTGLARKVADLEEILGVKTRRRRVAW